MRKYGFTLAEVLITLAIIGVVAALTIPSVVHNYQKQQTVVQLKKAYSTLSNTTNLAIANNGPVEGWVVYNSTDSVPDTSMKGSEHFAKTYLMPYLKVQKDCGFNTQKECAFTMKSPNGSTMGLSSVIERFILTDGTLIAVNSQNYINEDGNTQKQADIYVDINGAKPPNVWGRDVFYFTYFIYYPYANGKHNGKFLPYAYTHTREQLIENCGSAGYRCAALIMKDGWQIRDDYPW